MKNLVRILLSFAIASTSALAAPQPATGLLIYQSVANYTEIFEFASVTQKNLFDSIVVRPSGQEFTCKTENIVAVAKYPPLIILPDNEAEASKNIQDLVLLEQRYPKFRAQFKAMEAKWTHSVEEGKQAKLKEAIATKPSPKPGAFSFTTKAGVLYENVQISDIGVEGLSVSSDSGTSRVAFSELPEDLLGLPDRIKDEIKKKAQEAEQKRKQRRDYVSNSLEDAKKQVAATQSEIAALEVQMPSAKEIRALEAAAGVSISFRVEKELSFDRFPGLEKYGREIYQIRLGDNSLAILCTNDTSYSSRGLSSMRITYLKDYDVTLKSGNDATVPFVIETPEAALLPYQKYFKKLTELQALRAKLAGIKAQCKQYEAELLKP